MVKVFKLGRLRSLLPRHLETPEFDSDKPTEEVTGFRRWGTISIRHPGKSLLEILYPGLVKKRGEPPETEGNTTNQKDTPDADKQ